MAPLMVRPEHLFPFGEHGGFALLWTAPHTFEVHTFILPSGRGQWARAAAAEGIAMARDKGATRLWTKIPPRRPNVLAYAAGMGMTPTGESVVDDGVAHEIYAMELG
jgi:hypothetical protein